MPQSLPVLTGVIKRSSASPGSSGSLSEGVLSSDHPGAGALSHLFPQKVGVRWQNGHGSDWLARGCGVLEISPHNPECGDQTWGTVRAADEGHHPP